MLYLVCRAMIGLLYGKGEVFLYNTLQVISRIEGWEGGILLEKGEINNV